ncbi:patatin-like phospholipase family protein [Caulobacter sp. S45]|uniref:patatin-like phospholipase family protein n=1 Tax=Caulobacter sp. S45 TaxID=1641861 RepID=UPI001C2D2FA7|nr:patatin-like phospholipase family protein [Caulobacter sp. S45]
MLDTEWQTDAPSSLSDRPLPSPSDTAPPRPRRVLVLQGGGALGSYQAGVCEALQAAEVDPNWVAGISIGAINAALIAGNPPERRMERMRTFWEQASSGPFFSPGPIDFDPFRSFVNQISAATVATFGAPGFFKPRVPSSMFWPPGATEAISYYDTDPLRGTLEKLVDFDRINAGKTRLSVGAVNVQTGNSVVFDSAHQKIGPEHIMASGALPPGFAPVWIEGEAYWDGGLVSNTPLQFVLDDDQHEDLLIFQVDLFNGHGPMPRNMLEVDEREKDIRYSSRTRLNTDASLRIHKVKSALRALLDSLPEERADDPELAILHETAKENDVTVVQLIYRKQPYEGGSKDFEFSRQTMAEHWASGVADVQQTLERHTELLTQPLKPGVQVIDAGHLQDDATSPTA